MIRHDLSKKIHIVILKVMHNSINVILKEYVQYYVWCVIFLSRKLQTQFFADDLGNPV